MLAYGMMIGITVFVYLFWMNKTDKDTQNKRTIAAFFSMYIILLCLRDTSVGVDIKNYIRFYFEPLKDMKWTDALQLRDAEKGFLILTKLLGQLGGERLFLIAFALISVYPIMYLYKREAKDALLCCSFFFISLLFEMFFSGMRQGVAIGLTVPALYYARKKKLIPFVFFVLFAISFHETGLLIALIYPVYHARITRKWLWFVIPSMALIYIFRTQIFTLLLRSAGSYYVDNYDYLVSESSGQMGLLVLFVLLAIYSYVVLDEDRASKEDIGFRNLLLLATVIQLLTPVHPVVSRLNYYFVAFIPIAIGRVNSNCKIFYSQICKVASVVMSAFFVFYFFVLKDDSLEVFVYKLFF